MERQSSYPNGNGNGSMNGLNGNHGYSHGTISQIHNGNSNSGMIKSHSMSSMMNSNSNMSTSHHSSSLLRGTSSSHTQHGSANGNNNRKSLGSKRANALVVNVLKHQSNSRHTPSTSHTNMMMSQQQQMLRNGNKSNFPPDANTTLYDENSLGNDLSSNSVNRFENQSNLMSFEDYSYQRKLSHTSQSNLSACTDDTLPPTQSSNISRQISTSSSQNSTIVTLPHSQSSQHQQHSSVVSLFDKVTNAVITSESEVDSKKSYSSNNWNSNTLDEESSPRSFPQKSMCFSLEERVTSLVVTPDGCYVLVGLASGNIKLFDNTFDGNVDVEDRYGFVVGNIASANSNIGTLTVHIEIGSYLCPLSRVVKYSHVFAGASHGSTKLIAIDLKRLLDLKFKRGFITMAGEKNFGDKFYHNDSRLRGFVSLSPLTVNQIINNPSTDVSTSHSKYRLLCGKGFGQLHLWEVSFIQSIVLDSSHQDSKFEQKWTPLISISAGAPQSAFGAILQTKFESNVNIAVLAQGTQKIAKVHSISAHNPESELALKGGEESNDGQAEGDQLVNKSVYFKSLTNVYTCSKDGSVIFSGVDNLIVTVVKYESKGNEILPVIVSEQSYPLNNIQNTKLSASRKNSRHLRQIESVCCSEAGDYALVACSDQVVLVYRKRNGRMSSNELNDKNRLGDGSLQYWFQFPESQDIAMSMNLINNNTQDVVVCVCTWNIMSPTSGGIMRISRLIKNHDVNTFHDLNIALDTRLAPEFESSKACWLCGHTSVKHWKELSPANYNYFNDTSSSSGQSDNHHLVINKRNQGENANNKKRIRKGGEDEEGSGREIKGRALKFDSLCSPDVKTKNNVLQAASTDEDMSLAMTPPPPPLAMNNNSKDNQIIKHLQNKIVELENDKNSLAKELRDKANECELVVRKFDRRFANEMILRKEWNAQKAQYEQSIDQLRREVAILQNKVAEADRITSALKQIAGPLATLFNNNNSSPQSSDGIMSSYLQQQHVIASPSQQTSLSSPFCVVCQAGTAEVAILPCGHVCLCKSHALTMKANNNLTRCPLCQASVTGILQLQA